MPRQIIPVLRRKFSKGREFAVVSITDFHIHKRRDYHCGTWGTPEADRKYRSLIAEWQLADRRWPCRPADDQLTVMEVIQRYWRWAEPYYAKGETQSIHNAWKVLAGHCPDLVATSFGPIKLREVRQAMIEKGWTRKSINRQVQRIAAIFRWAAGQELLPITVFQTLKAIEPLKRGRCLAPESKPVKPVDLQYVEAVKPWVSRQVWAVIELQRLTGARPGELLVLKRGDINRDDDIWRAELDEHKTSHHGKARTLYFGPAAKIVLEPFMLRLDDAYLFSPAEAESERLAIATQNRKTPSSCGNVASGKPRKAVGEFYTTASYRRAIARACVQAEVPDWHPHQLRHTAATQIRKRFGLEAAAVVLGHSSAAITDSIYAERDAQKVIDVMKQIG